MQRQQAIVLGSGIAGLMAARVLSDQFAQVVILEKDPLPKEVEDRRGIPQGRHAHAILARGLEGMETLFPGLQEDLLDQGAVSADVTADVLWYRSPGFKARFESGLVGLMLSRALLEHTLRLRVALLPNVRFVEGARVKGLLWEGGQVRGAVFIQGEIEAEMQADLVVDAMGRGSPSLAWLEAMGYARPQESKIPVDIAYASRIFRVEPGLFEAYLEGAKGMSVSPLAPHEKRGGFLSVLEGDRFIVTLGGRLGEVPPADEAGWLEFAKSLPVPHFYQMARYAEPLTEITPFRFPANVLRHFERLSRFPAGFLVLGDALCAFNPVYGQGMTSAVLQAEALQQSHPAGAAKLRHPASAAKLRLEGQGELAQSFFRLAAQAVEAPWQLAAGADAAYLPGAQPSEMGQYLERLHRLAETDREVARAFFEVANLKKPLAYLRSSEVVARVMAASERSDRHDPPLPSSPARA